MAKQRKDHQPPGQDGDQRDIRKPRDQLSDRHILEDQGIVSQGASLQDLPCRPGKDRQGSQGHDERRNAAIGEDQSVDPAEQHPGTQADEKGAYSTLR